HRDKNSRSVSCPFPERTIDYMVSGNKYVTFFIRLQQHSCAKASRRQLLMSKPGALSGVNYCNEGLQLLRNIFCGHRSQYRQLRKIGPFIKFAQTGTDE